MIQPQTELTGTPWTRESEYRFVHRSGALIERRGYPALPGWYLVSDQRGPALHRFEPTPQGCDARAAEYSGGAAAAAFTAQSET